MRRIAELRLSEKDKMVINAFIDQKPAESKKLLTNGMRLDGVWMGGSNIAHWEGGRIVTNDLGSRAAQTVQNFLKRNTPKNLLRTANMGRTAGEVIRELEMRVARLERSAGAGDYTLEISGEGRRFFRKEIKGSDLSKIKSILVKNIGFSNMYGVSWSEGRTNEDVHGSITSIDIMGSHHQLVVSVIPPEPAVFTKEKLKLHADMEGVLRHLRSIRFI